MLSFVIILTFLHIFLDFLTVSVSVVEVAVTTSEREKVVEEKDSSMSSEDREKSDADQRGVTAAKKTKKKVSWVEDINLKQIFYFELDETERGKSLNLVLFRFQLRVDLQLILLS